MSSELARAIRFTERMRERMAASVVPWRYGDALFHPGLPHVRDLNCARLRAADASPGAVATACLEIHRAAAVGHARLDIGDAAAAARLAPPFADAGWAVSRELVMIHRGRHAAPSASHVVELDADALRSKWAAGIRSSVDEADVAAQLLEAQILRGRAVSVRYFGIRSGGEVVSECSLFSEGGVAQVESVHTLAEHRGRGLARAVVERAVAEAYAAGHELVFLRADADDWPRHFYRRLAFEEVGSVWELLCAETGARAPQAREAAT